VITVLVVLALGLVLALALPKVGPAKAHPMKKKRVRKENPMLLGLRWVPTSVTSAPLWFKSLPTKQQLVVARTRKREAS